MPPLATARPSAEEALAVLATRCQQGRVTISLARENVMESSAKSRGIVRRRVLRIVCEEKRRTWSAQAVLTGRCSGANLAEAIALTLRSLTLDPFAPPTVAPRRRSTSPKPAPKTGVKAPRQAQKPPPHG